MQTSDLRESIDGWAFSRRSSHVDISPLYASAIALLAVTTSKPTGVRDFALGCLLVDAGLRVSEACGLTWGDIALVEGVLHVRGQLAPLKPGEAPKIVPPKSERGVRTVPLLPRLQAALETLYAGEDDSQFVLHTRRGTPLSRHNARRSIREAGERAKLGRVTPHTLRRTTGTALSEARVPEAAAAAMGHSLQGFHGTYARLTGTRWSVIEPAMHSSNSDWA